MKTDQVFYAATQILAASCAGAKGEGLHESPALVTRSVNLAKQLVAATDDDAAADAADLVTAKAGMKSIADELAKERTAHAATQAELHRLRTSLPVVAPPEPETAPVVGDPAIVAALAKAEAESASAT